MTRIDSQSGDEGVLLNRAVHLDVRLAKDPGLADKVALLRGILKDK